MNKENEHKKITRAVSIFSEYMAKRMLQKMDKGFHGWTAPQDYDIAERLLYKAQKIQESPNDKDLIDIGNFAMMLFVAEYDKMLIRNGVKEPGSDE